MNTDNQPDGWTRVKFGDVVRKVNDRVDPDTAGIERYVAGEHMDTDDLAIRRWGEVGDGYLGPAFHMRFKPGQVLYGSRRTYLRKVAVADFEGITANTTFVLEPSSVDLLPEFLPLVMTTEAFHDHSVKQSKGSVNPYINFSDLTWYEFVLPPVEEQRRVAETLAAADVGLAGCTSAREATVRLRQAVRESLFQAAKCKGSLVPLAEMADVVDCEHKTAPSAPGHHQVIGTPDVRNGELNLASARTVSEETYRAWTRRAEPRIGDIVFTREAPVGEVAVISENGRFCLGQRTVLIRPKDDRLSRWLEELLQAPSIQRVITDRSAGTTTRHLNVLQIRELGIPQFMSEDETSLHALRILSMTATVHDTLSRQMLALRQLRHRVLEECTSVQ